MDEQEQRPGVWRRIGEGVRIAALLPVFLILILLGGILGAGLGELDGR